LLLAREPRRLAHAQQELALDGDRLRPAARCGVDVTQPARETRALRLREPRPLERLGGGTQVTGALAGLGQEVEESRIETHAHEPVVDHLARGGRITLLEVRLREARHPRHTGRYAPLPPPPP